MPHHHALVHAPLRASALLLIAALGGCGGGSDAERAAMPEAMSSPGSPAAATAEPDAAGPAAVAHEDDTGIAVEILDAAQVHFFYSGAELELQVSGAWSAVHHRTDAVRTVTIRLDGGARFSPRGYDPRCELADEEHASVVCTVGPSAADGVPPSRPFPPIGLRVEVPDYTLGQAIDVTASLASAPDDPNPANDRVTRRWPAPDRAFDYALVADVSAEGALAHLARAGETLALAVRLEQREAFVLPAEATIIATAPPGATLLGARFEHTGTVAGAGCTVAGGQARCTIEPGGGTPDGRMVVDYEVGAAAEQTLQWRVESGAGDRDAANGQMATLVLVAETTEPLQALIDAAGDGERIDLPAGVYVGTLDGRGRQLHVRGASGVAPTVLVTTANESVAVSNPGRDSLYEHLTFRLSGRGFVGQRNPPAHDGLTIANSRFEPLPGSAHRVDLVEVRGAVRFIGNVVSGFGQGAGYCNHLLEPLGSGAWSIERNVFVDNDCAVILFNEWDEHALPPDAAPPSASVVRNTFVRNATLGMFFKPAVYRIDIADNVIVDTARLFSMPEWFFEQVGRGHAAHTHNNLLSGNPRDALLDERLVASGHFRIVSPDVATRPRFVDASGDYRPASGSAAIDAASVPPSWPTPTSSPNAFSFDPLPIPLDGLGDGHTVPDIGALEYRPGVDGISQRTR